MASYDLYHLILIGYKHVAEKDRRPTMNSVVSKFLDVQEFILSHPYTFGTLAAGAGALTVVYAVSSWCLRRRKCESNACLDDKVVIITGANTGIGYETALNLATRNARVILACRNVAKGETAAAEVRKKTGNGNVVFRHLDLASIRSIRRFAAEILEEETKIDILVNNAGLIESDFLKTEDGFEMIFGVNHLGHFHLTNLLINRLKESPAARIVVVSAYMQGYKESFDFDLVNRSTLRRTGLVRVSYAQSKLANWLFTKALARRLEGGRVTVNALHPGFINTEMSDDIANIMPIWIRPLARLIGRLFLRSPLEGAQTSIHCAVSEDLEGVSGKFYTDCQEVTLTSSGSTSDEDAERLWELSQKLIDSIQL